MEKLHNNKFIYFFLVLGFLFTNIAIVDAAKTPVKQTVTKAVPVTAVKKVTQASIQQKAAPVKTTVPTPVKKIASAAKAPSAAPVSATIDPVQVAPSAPAPVISPVAAGPIIPGRLIIPSIGVNAVVKALGLEPDGKMDVPDNFTEVGWYKLGTKPGDVGSAVMGAHVDNGGSVNGVFKNLKNLAIGDEISVADESGKMLTFRVSEKRVLDYREKSTGDIFGNVGKKRLNLITCHGTYMPSVDTYNQRLIVFADLVE